MTKNLLLLVFLSSCLFSCKNYKCSDAVSQIAFIKFQPNETDTIIVRKFTKATNFSSLSDTFLLNKNNTNYSLYTDTLTVYHAYGNDMGITSKYDYEVYIPQTNRLYRLTEITEDFQEKEQGLFSTSKLGCINPIVSYKQNGQLQTVPNSGYGNFYFLK